MHKRLLACAVVSLVFSSSALLPASQEPSSSGASSVSPHRALLNRYCVTCHNEKLRTAELLLDEADVDNVSENTALWEKVVIKLRSAQMPPGGMPRPDKTNYDSFATYLEAELDQVAAADPNPGRTAPVHRLNRAEYANSIRDLLALEIDGASLLPADDSSGFDNNGHLLSVSPMLTEKYMAAARKISRLAVGDASIPEDIVTYDMPLLLIQDERMSEDLPFGSRGGMAIRHYFPVDAEYVIKVRLQRTPDRGYVRGIAEPQLLDVRLDGERLKLFTFGGQHKGKAEGSLAADSAPSDYSEAEYQRTADAGLEIRFLAKAGSRLVQVAFPRETYAREGVFQTRPRTNLLTIATGAGDETDASLRSGVGSVSISGPFRIQGPGETPSRRRVFVCRPTGSAEEQPCARKILSTLARRAFRRPVSDGEVQTLLGLYAEGQSDGGFEAGIELAVRGILVSPQFLFRLEQDPPNVEPDTSYRISDIELASRLAFFLWSSIPDDELLDLAETGQLREPIVLEAQVQRMMADPRSSALVSNFAGQWLYLRNINTVHPNQDIFSEFDENLRNAFRQETNLFMESMIREDRSLLDLLRADYTFVNERLARHYGIPNVFGSRFRRVTLTDENRKGLLGKGSILTVSSLANRTSPVMRGKWVLDNLLGTPPPEPPPNVPALQEKGDQGEALTMRQQMEQHRANPACAVCHRVMDPIGFALENFDAIGQWRTDDSGMPIDPSGVLPDGQKFQGPAELQEILLQNPEQFVRTATVKLLAYALGRSIEDYDAPSARKIVREAVPSGYRWSSIINGIVKSTPFQMRRSRDQ